MIEDVEDFRAQLKSQFLGDVSVFEDRNVDVAITWSAQRVSTKRSEMPRARNTRSSTAVTRWIQRARHLEGRQIDEPVRRTRARIRITDEIGSREKLTGVVVIIK